MDVYVATGFDEGGTVPKRVIGTFSIIPMIVDTINIPVMAAGGIGDVRGVRATFAAEYNHTVEKLRETITFKVVVVSLSY